MSTPSHGIKFVLPGRHIVLYVRDAEGVSILAPRETPYPIRLEVLATNGALLSAWDYTSFDAFAEGRGSESDEVLT